jgi:hypothetical protein
MKTKLTLLSILFVGIVFTSCKKDKDEVTPFNSKYADKTVEENKQSLEDNGIEMVGKLDELKSATGIEVAFSFADKSQYEVTGKTVSLNIKPINIIASLKQSNNYKEAVSSLKSTMEDPQSIIDVWDSIVGKYTWNSTDEVWDYSPLSDAIVFEFPGKEGDTENTATITVDNFNTVTISNPDFGIDSIINPIFPTSLNVELKYNSTVLSTFAFTAAYAETGLPTSVEVVLTVDDFSLSAKATHTPYTSASIKYSFKQADNILVEMYADASGNWSEENIDANTTTDEWGDDEVAVENILKNGNAYVQLMNVKLAGMVDVKSLATVGKDLDQQAENETITEQEYYDKLVDAYNKYIKLVVVYADTKEKIANAEFFAVEETDDWGTYYSIDVRFVFADGSKVSAETYFSEGFDDLVGEINDFITNVNNEYDVNIDPIEY